MAEAKVIQAKQRTANGKSGARSIRLEGRVPGVIYGGGVDTQDTISMDANELGKVIRRGGFLSSILEVDVDGNKSRVIPRDVQLDPVRDTLLHVDFQRIRADERIRIMVAIHFLNEEISPGLKRGGVLNVVRREIEVWAFPDQIPEYFEADLKELEIGDSIHVSAVDIPEGIELEIDDRDFTIATIVGAVPDKNEDDAADGAATAAAAEDDDKDDDDK